MRYGTGVMLSAVLIACLQGCGGLVTWAMIHAPNHGKKIESFKPSAKVKLQWLGLDREMRIAVGPPEASIRLFIIEPRVKGRVTQPKGTLLVMHGYRGSIGWVIGRGKALARAGYRVVLADLRGHGDSSGDYITYGVRESRDMAQVIDHLAKEGVLAGRLGVWGISMGGATAIQLAAMDSRVASVVAVAPFTSLRQVAPALVRKALPIYGWFLSDEAIQSHVADAGRVAGFNPDDTDTLAAIRKTRAPVLLIHGKWDVIVPIEHSRRLHAAAPDHSRLTEVGMLGHISAHFSTEVDRLAIEWLDEHLTDAPQKD